MRLSATTLCTLAALLLPASAIAQDMPFEAEIDCDGFFAPGEAVPYVMELVNETSAPITVDLTLEIDIPTRGARTLKNVTVELPGDLVRFKEFQLTLPAGAPNGEYELRLYGRSGDLETFDTCSFHGL